MNRFRSILLSGLVALLMVGMVSAGEDQGVIAENDEIDSFIGIYMGGWAGDICVDELEGGCVKIWISFDFEWFKKLLF